MNFNQDQVDSKFGVAIFLIVLSFLLWLNYIFFYSLFHALAFSAILAGTFYPLMNKLRGLFKWKDSRLALLTTFIIIIVLLVPSIYLITQLSLEASKLYALIQSGLSNEKINNLLFEEGPVAIFIKKASATFNISVDMQQIKNAILAKAQDYTSILLKMANSLIGDGLSFIFHFFLTILGTYGILAYGQELKEYFFELSPLPTIEEQHILDRFNQMNYATMVGNGIGGLIQGISAGLIFWMANIPSVFLWSTIMIVLAFIPLVGISFVTIPASLYLYFTGSKLAGILVLISTLLIASIVENWFKPKFMGDKVSVNGLVVFFYIIAGMGLFGMAGIFYGPLLCVISVTIFEIFMGNYLPYLSGKNKSLFKIIEK